MSDESKLGNGTKVRYETEKYGTGAGAVVGFYSCPIEGDCYIVYPKMMLKSTYDYMCFVAKRVELIETPF